LFEVWARSSWGRHALVLIPTLAVGTAAVVLLGPGASRAVLAARVYGAPGPGPVALRLITSTSSFGVEEAVAVRDLKLVTQVAGAARTTWTGETSSDGVAEVTLEATGGPLPVVLLSKNRPVAMGTIDGSGRRAPTVSEGRVTGTTRGDFEVEVVVERGAMAAPFPEWASISVKRGGRRATGVAVTLAAPGAEFPTGATTTTDESGTSRFRIKPLAHTIELAVELRRGGESGRWEGFLPVVPGAIWWDPEAGRLVSATARMQAYVSWWSGTGRVGGKVVALERGSDGFSYAPRGAFEPPAGAGARFLTVAGDPLEQGSGTITWPSRPEGRVRTPRLELLIDGLPQALASEKGRAFRARRAGVVVIGAAGVVEILLLLLRGRQAQRALELHLSTALGEEGKRNPAPAGLLSRSDRVLFGLLSAAVIGFAFALLAAFASFG
jgi:hypothetical protein